MVDAKAEKVAIWQAMCGNGMTEAAAFKLEYNLRWVINTIKDHAHGKESIMKRAVVYYMTGQGEKPTGNATVISLVERVCRAYKMIHE